MKNKFFTFSKPYLSVIDKGIFFRKPFSWLYIFFAVLSLLAPIYLIYSAFNLHAAYITRDKAREKFEIVSRQFQIVKQKYESAVQVANQSKSESREAYENYRNANSNASYYSNYLNYYREEYDRARQQANQWYSTWQEAEKRNSSALEEVEKIRPEYEKGSNEYDQSNQEYQATVDKYDSVAPKGAFHKAGIRVKALFALLLFSVLSVFIGLVNFQIFWDRKSKMDLTSKDNDEFTAIPAIAHYIQTLGESIGTYIAIMGTFTTLIAILFNVCFGTYGLGRLFLTSLEDLSNHLVAGIPYLFLPVLAGFTIIVLFRVIGEGIKAIVVIANNTRK